MSTPAIDSLAPLEWGAWNTPYLFFTGRGGVGKTTTASGVAVALAEQGERTLLISTDPASNLEDVFGVRVGAEPVLVPETTHLFLLNIDPEQAAADYRERTLAPYRGKLPASAIESMEEQLAGACTVEIAAFNEFTSVLASQEIGRAFDRVLFDTAPTGHTLRLLGLPSAWSGFVETNPAGATCLGPLAGLDRQRDQYATAVATLADATRTTLVLVTRPERAALHEAARASGELARIGVRNQQLVVNGVLRDVDYDPIARALGARQTRALADAPAELDTLRVHAVDLVAGDVTGLDDLRELIGVYEPTVSFEHDDDTTPPPLPELRALVSELDHAGHGVVLMMGKGGVGKTTIASAVAVALADRGREVVLSTTDPAAHLETTLGDQVPHGLRVERIDPALETARYSAEVLASVDGLDEEGRALLEEDLRSPCTEEIAVFRAFARTVEQARDRIVILDTAPTGHTLLLLDAANSYHREIERTAVEVPDEVRALVGRLRDPQFAHVVIITLAESTPVREAERLQADLRRARIEPFGWLINASLVGSGTRHPVLAARAVCERGHTNRVRVLSWQRTWWVGWQPHDPVGVAALRDLAHNGPRPTQPARNVALRAVARP